MSALERFFDVRPPERRAVAATFAALLLMVVAHTLLETARDTLFLQHVGVRALGHMYVVTAALTLAVGSFAGWLGSRVGPRRALVAAQVITAFTLVGFFFLPPTKLVLTALYAFSAVSGALLVPQLWIFAATIFHASQSRRLFGTIALAGVAGAVLGSSLAAAALLALPVQALLLLAAAAQLLATTSACVGPESRARTGPHLVANMRESVLSLARREPILLRIALVVALGAITTLLVDYYFKAAISAKVPSADLGPFLARYYALMNVLALLVQLFLVRRVMARAGVVATSGMLPSMLFTGSLVTLLTGGAMMAVLATKAADAGFRHSVHRTASELLYSAVPPSVRDRAKPVIDGAVARVSQALGAGLLLLLAALDLDSARHIALLAVGFAGLWGAATYSLRNPYLALFRRSLLGDRVGVTPSRGELDLASAELLVEALSSPRGREVVAAMRALERRGRTGLIPALVLLQEDEEVLVLALDLFGSSARKDWIPFAERRATDRRELVRRAALRALARAKLSAPASKRSSEGDDPPWIRGYLAVTERWLAEDGVEAALAALRAEPRHEDEFYLGAIVAIADGGADRRAADLLFAIVSTLPKRVTRELVETIARTATVVADERLLPWLVARLDSRDARALVRKALVALGRPAYVVLATKLESSDTPRRLRVHLPRSLSGFGTQEAADLLFRVLSTDRDGLVRYKCLRGLGALVVGHGATLAAAPLRAIALRDLREHFRLAALATALDRAPLSAAGSAANARTLLARLLQEKQEQALERAFRLLKLSYPEEDIHHVHRATTSGDASTRANALEFLEALLAPQRRRAPSHDLRPLLRILFADLPREEAVLRALGESGLEAPDERTVLATLTADNDATVAALAQTIASGAPMPSTAPPPAAKPERGSLADALANILGDRPLAGGAHG